MNCNTSRQFFKLQGMAVLHEKILSKKPISTQDKVSKQTKTIASTLNKEWQDDKNYQSDFDHQLS